MATDGRSNKAAWQLSYRDLAHTRIDRQGLRLFNYVLYAIFSAIYVPLAWWLTCLGALLLIEYFERRLALRLLADGAPASDSEVRSFGITHVLTAVGVSVALSVLWIHSPAVTHAVPLAFLAIAILNVAVVNNQVRPLLLARQGLYAATAVGMVLYDVLTAERLGLIEAAALLPIGAYAVFSMLMSDRAAKLYRSQLEQKNQLGEARDAAEAADAAKTAFIATVSHELRTPLNGVLGMTQTLLRTGLTPEQKRHVEVILESGRTLNALLTDILDYSKLDAGKLVIEAAEEEPRRTVDEIARLYGPVAADKGLKLEAKVAPEVPQTLVYDAVRVRQCLSNLVANAVKFTETGSVTLSLSSEPAAPGSRGQKRQLVRAVVRDTGIGIPADRQKHLFQPFAQADGTISRRYGGTGLGLSITRQLAESMGGGVSLQSAPGKGSEFTLTFVAEEAPAADGRPGASVELADRRVLVVDDIESNRMVMRLFLQPLGIEVVEASDGAAALGALTDGNFDAALLDMHLPGMSGSEIAARIRRDEGGHSNLAILAVTADSFEAGIDLDDSGFDGVVNKPVDQRQLQAKLISAMLSRSASRTIDHEAAAAAAGPSDLAGA